MDKITKIFESLTTSASIQIRIDAKQGQKFFKTKAGGKKKRTLAVFKGDDSISGIVQLNIREGEELEHFGVKVMLIGYLQIYDDSTLSTQFHSLSKQLLPAGTLKTKTTLKFKFTNFDKQYQSFYGVCGQVRYLLRTMIVMDRYLPNITKQIPFAVFKYEPSSKYKQLAPVKMDIGSEGKISIQLELGRNCFHLKDCMEGVVKFTEVKIVVKSMELCLIRKEKLGSEKLVENDTQTMIQYELMDGSPQPGQTIPIRLYLNGVNGLSPSFTSLHDRLTVSYLIKLVIIDSLGKKYFKEAPITLYRLLKE